MNKYYLIICKNDFPPVNKYTIMVYDRVESLPLRYKRKCLSPSGWTTYEEQIIKVPPDEICYLVGAKDPVEALIKFWSAYMYNIPGEGKG